MVEPLTLVSFVAPSPSRARPRGSSRRSSVVPAQLDRRRRSMAAVAAVAALLLVGGFVAVAVPAAHGRTVDELDYLDRINALRASAGVAPLVVDPTMTALADAHTREMVATRNLFHTPVLRVGADPGWSKLGENVGYGPSVDVVWRLLLASPEHLANMVDPAFQRIGISVIVDDRGTGWTTHRFVGGASPPVTDPTTTAPTPHAAAAPTMPDARAPSTIDAAARSAPAWSSTAAPSPAEPARVAAMLDALLNAFR